MDRGFVNGSLTLTLFVIFIVIVFWAFSSRKKKDFDDAANAPFAAPDETENPNQTESVKQSMNHRNVNHDE